MSAEAKRRRLAQMECALNEVNKGSHQHQPTWRLFLADLRKYFR